MRHAILLAIITTSLFLTPLGLAASHDRPVMGPACPPLLFTPGGNTTLVLDIDGTVTAQQLLWSANTTGTNYEESAVTVSGGIAYIGSCATHGAGHDKLFAVDITDGSILWSYDTGPGYVGPVIDGDTVYLGTCTHGYYPDNEHLYAFDRTNGHLRWTIPIYGGIAESIQTDATKLYFGTGFYNTKIMAVYKTNGSIAWTYPTDNDVGPNKPMLKDNTIYVAFWKDYGIGHLYKVNATTGQAIWTVTLSSGPWDNSITTDGHGRLFLAIYADSTMNAYRDSDGGLIWSKPLYAPPLSFNAYHNGHVFIADTGGHVYCFNATDGTEIWETPVGSDCDISSPTLSGGLLFIGTRDGPDGAYLALDESTGEILWRYPIGASVTCPPSIVGGTMYCGSDGWNLYAFDFGTGGGDWLRHRYDSWNTAYSPIGLAQWQFIRASCTTQQGVITCVVDNTYDHDVHNITLQLSFPAYWYDEEGVLLAANASQYTLPSMTAEQSRTLKITYTPVIQVSITRPVNGIYLADTRVLPFRVPVAFGHLQVEALVTPNQSIDKVEFKLDGMTICSTSSPPYRFQWTQRSFGSHVVKAVAYSGNVTASAEIQIWKFF